jgi:hypothetical protein
LAKRADVIRKNPMNSRPSITVLLDEYISDLNVDIPKLQQELKLRQRELYVLKSARLRLSDHHVSSPHLSPIEIAGKKKDSSSVEALKWSLARAARSILRDRARPMRVGEILSAIHEAGHKDVKHRPLNLALYREVQQGRLAHPENGIYSYIDATAFRTGDPSKNGGK